MKKNQGKLLSDSRAARQSNVVDVVGDSRDPFQRDRDRVLYSDYFRRLAGVTQVASAGEGVVFHNRLTHSLKVAQVARRLAERLLSNNKQLVHILSPDVVEAAALAHDLGHPPFGHVAEKRLCELADCFGLSDGFEGNAQTFRILVRLSVHKGRAFGLDLTRATLAATLKYPWTRSPADSAPGVKPNRRKKYCVYEDDKAAFDFAYDHALAGGQSLEAQVMDLADSITYSVHDLEDFFRAGLIPLERILKSPYYRLEFLERWAKASPNDKGVAYARDQKNFLAIQGLLDFCIDDCKAEHGSQLEAEMLDGFRSAAITAFLSGVELSTGEGGTPKIDLGESYSLQCSFFHRLVRDYVIDNPRLATQQAGQVKVVDVLTRFFRQKLLQKKEEFMPARFRMRASHAIAASDPKRAASRLAIDIVASLSEAEAVMFYRRVTGNHSGSILDLVH